jgi:D-aspartate ligase
VMKNTIILNKMYYTPTVKKDIEELMDKSCQTEIAKVCGLNIPKSMVMRKGDKIIWNDFPCIIKPIKSFIGGGKSDIHIASSYEELCNDFNNTVAETIQVQKYIKKRIEYQIIGCSLNAGEICIIPGYTDIIRQPQNTNTGYLRYSPIVKLDIDLEKIRAFIRNIGYSGLFSVEFIRAEDNKDYFLEINMRNDGNAYCVTAAGVNLPYIWAYYNIYNQFPIEEKRDFINDVILIPDFADIGLGIRTIGVFKWFIQMITADCHTVWNKNDINPFFCDMQVFLVRNIKKVLKRIIP